MTTPKITEKKAVLIVDDDTANLTALKFLLKKDYIIYTASSGRMGLEILEENKVDLIISDQRMPEMTGTEFLNQALINFPSIVRLILTAYTDVESMLDSINKCHVYKYLTKPVDPDTLKNTIKDALRQNEIDKQKDLLIKELEIKIKETSF